MSFLIYCKTVFVTDVGRYEADARSDRHDEEQEGEPSTVAKPQNIRIE